MIYIFGDSHANNSYRNMNINGITVLDLHCPSITMHRIGRDGVIINFDDHKNSYTDNDVFILCYGEVDCRCHIKKQMNLGVDEELIISELVNNYFHTIVKNISKNNKIIITAVIPPIRRESYENIHGPITHDYPFVGTNEERLRFTQKMNSLLEFNCEKLSKHFGYSFHYFNPYSQYVCEDGHLDYSKTDDNVHIGNNDVIIEEFCAFYSDLCVANKQS